MLQKALQRDRHVAYLPLLWLPVAVFTRFVVGLTLLVRDGHLGLEERPYEQHIAYSRLFIIATIGLFDLSVSDVDAGSKEAGDLLQQEVLVLVCLKLTRCNGRHLAAQDELITGWTELPLLLERLDAGDVIVEFLLRHHDTVLLGQAQDDRPGRQLFERHLTEIEAVTQIHRGLGTENGTITLLYCIVHALELTHADRLAKNGGHF